MGNKICKQDKSNQERLGATYGKRKNDKKRNVHRNLSFSKG